LRISGHAPRQLEAQNRCGAPASLFLLLHFASFSHSFLCTLLLHSSLSLTLSFSLSRILSRFLAHVLTGTWCSRVVLPHLSLSFVVSFTPFSHFLVLIDFVWVDFRSLVLFSLSTRGIFSYLCMLGMLSGYLYHKFRVSKFFGRKNFKWP